MLKKKKEELIYLAKNKSKEKKQIKTKHVKQPRKHTLSLAMVLLKQLPAIRKPSHSLTAGLSLLLDITLYSSSLTSLFSLASAKALAVFLDAAATSATILGIGSAGKSGTPRCSRTLFSISCANSGRSFK